MDPCDIQMKEVPSQDDNEQPQGQAHHKGSESDFSALTPGSPKPPVSGANEVLMVSQISGIAEQCAFKREECLLSAFLGTPVLISYTPLSQQEGGWPELDLEKPPSSAVSGFLWNLCQ